MVSKMQQYEELLTEESVYSYDAIISGPKHKIPWIEYNGVTIGDSSLIISFLNKKFNINLNKDLTKEQQAMAWAIQKWMEEYTFHLNMYTKWFLFSDDFIPKYTPGVPKWVMSGMKRYYKTVEFMVGISRHTDKEVFDMNVFDMRQISVILGNKKYIMGTEGPTEVDCVVFGILSEVRWNTPDDSPDKKILKGELPNLMAYLDRIKQTYWPDWDELLYDNVKA